MPESFADYEKRKVERAKEVKTPGVVTVVNRAHLFQPQLKKLEHPVIEQVLNGPFYYFDAKDPNRSSANLVFVEDVNGNTGSDEPWTLGGGETDFMLYEGLSRVHVDAIIVGSETARGIALSIWHPELVDYRVNGLHKRPYPINVITTRRGDLDIENGVMFSNPNLEVVILTTDEGKAKLEVKMGNRTWVHAETTGEKSDMKEGFRILRQKYKIEFASVIGGRTLATELLNLGLIDELYWTKTSIEAAPENTPLYLGDLSHYQAIKDNPKELAKHLKEVRSKLEKSLSLVIQHKGTGPEEGVLFEHHLVRKLAVVLDRRNLQKAA